MKVIVTIVLLLTRTELLLSEKLIEDKDIDLKGGIMRTLPFTIAVFFFPVVSVFKVQRGYDSLLRIRANGLHKSLIFKMLPQKQLPTRNGN